MNQQNNMSIFQQVEYKKSKFPNTAFNSLDSLKDLKCSFKQSEESTYTINNSTPRNH
jgi:hypothetical protein